jgi:hypothetical protein
LPQKALTTERQLGFGAIANTAVEKTARAEAERQQVHELADALYSVFKDALAESGGADALRARLDEVDSFKTYVSKAANRVVDGTGQRRVPLEWLAGVGVDSDGAYALVAGINRTFGFQPPVRERVLTREEIADTNLEIEAEMPEHQKKARKAEIARRRGVRPEDVKL